MYNVITCHKPMTDLPMKNKKMLIIGYDFSGVECWPWDSLSEDRINQITDYQVVLINTESCKGVKNSSLLQSNIGKLILQHHTVIFFLARKNHPYNYEDITPFVSPLEFKKGTTLDFSIEDSFITSYKKFLHGHEIVYTSLHQRIANREIDGIVPLIRNNVSQICGYRINNSYVLHAPEDYLFEKAISLIIDTFSPNLLEEKFQQPEWLEQYILNDLGAKSVVDKISKIETEIDKLVLEKEKSESEKLELSKWADLLFTQGKTLEHRLKEAFEFLEVDSITLEPNGNHGPDLVLRHDGSAFTIEVEGSKGAIKIDKARQLLHWIADSPTDHKGVLIGNPFREMDPSKRPPDNYNLFVKEVVQLAEKRNLVLLPSFEIFRIVSLKLQGGDVDIKNFLDDISSTKGLYSTNDSKA